MLNLVVHKEAINVKSVPYIYIYIYIYIYMRHLSVRCVFHKGRPGRKTNLHICAVQCVMRPPSPVTELYARLMEINKYRNVHRFHFACKQTTKSYRMRRCVFAVYRHIYDKVSMLVASCPHMGSAKHNLLPAWRSLNFHLLTQQSR
jgi:hypothetical protein